MENLKKKNLKYDPLKDLDELVLIRILQAYNPHENEEAITDSTSTKTLREKVEYILLSEKGERIPYDTYSRQEEYKPYPLQEEWEEKQFSKIAEYRTELSLRAIIAIFEKQKGEKKEES